MLSVLLGLDGFRKGMDLYFERHDGRAATIEDFLAVLRRRDRPRPDAVHAVVRAGGHAAGRGVAAIGTRRARTYRLDLAQATPPTPGQPHKEPMVIPLVVGLLGPDGRDMPLMHARRQRRRARRDRARPQASQSFTFSGIVPARPVLSLAAVSRRRSSSPRDESVDELCASWRRTTPIRSTAGRRCRRSRRRCWSTIPRRRGPASRRGTTEGLVDALAAVLDDRALEPAFVAQALALPSEADIAREIGRDVDPDAIFTARSALRATLGRALRDKLRASL